MTRAFPISEDELRAHYTADLDSPDINASVPTGWNMLATYQAGWKQVRDETITQKIDNLQVDLKDSRNEVNKSLAALQAASHMILYRN